MKKIKLIFPIVLTSFSGLAIAPLSSCNKYEMSETTKAIVDEFIGNGQDIEGITSIPRPSNFCYYIAAHLENYLGKILAGETTVSVDKYNNVWCTIPATNGCENWQPLMLQGHLDMVVAGMTEEESLEKGIDAVIDGSTIHSRGFKTSLGADNGIGAAMMIHLIKTRHDYNHGLLRFIFTADEEVGLIGAHYFDREEMKVDGTDIPFLLNLDAENKGEVYRSCTGNFLGKFYHTYDKQDPTTGEVALEYPIDIKLDGLAGGHSGLDIGKGRANADRILFELLNALREAGIKVQLVAYNHEKLVDGKIVDIKWETNQLIQNGHVQFLCDKTHKDIDPIIESCIQKWKNKYPGENYDNWKFNSGSFTWTQDVGFIDEKNTDKLIKLIGSNDDPTSEEKQKLGMPYGVFARKPEAPTDPLASGNIGPVKISDGTKEKTIDFEIRDLVRTSVYGTATQPATWCPYTMEANYQIAATNVAGVEYFHESGYQPWQFKQDVGNKLVDFLKQDYEKIGVTPTITDSKGGVEPAEWITKNPNLICSCIGAQIDNAHTTKETLHLDTIDVCFKAIQDTIAWMENPTV